MRAAVAALVAIFAIGCAPNLRLRTPAPPMTTINLSGASSTIELTQGVGAGFGVWCEWEPCEEVRATTDRPDVARVFMAHLDPPRDRWSAQRTPAVVLVGVAPGATTLHVWNGSHRRDFTVAVLAEARRAPVP